MDFGTAFIAIKNAALYPTEDSKSVEGMRLPRWGVDVIIKVQVPDQHSKMTPPYLYVQSPYGRVPWKESMIELFSDEWIIVYNTNN